MACQNHAKESGATPQNKNYIIQSIDYQSYKKTLKTKQPFTFSCNRSR